MNIAATANAMVEMILMADLPDGGDSYGKDHLLMMANKIMDGEVTDDKAHRWLGYIQGVLVSHDGGTLEDMMKANSL